MGKTIEDKLPDYFACLLDFLAKDISAKLTILERLAKRVKDESDEIGDTADTAIPEEEMMLALLLLPLTRRYPELGKQISILETLLLRLSESSSRQPTQLSPNDGKLEKLIAAWCCLESERRERVRLVREELMLQSQVYCWP